MEGRPARALYDGLLSQVYDDHTAQDRRDDLGLWARLAAAAPGPGLELGCGTGRVLLPLLRSGLQVEGLDNSADMLARCWTRAVAEGLRPELHLAEMTNFRLGRRFAFAFCAAGSFTLLAGRGEMEAALAALRVHLVPGGLLALAMDAPGPAAESPVLARDIQRPGDGARLRCLLAPRPCAEPEVARWVMTNEVIRADGAAVRDTRPIAFRRPAPDALAARLEDAGFEGVELLDAAGARPLRLGEETYLALARAPGGTRRGS